MCGCEGFYVCPRCAGTPADPLYVDDEPREPLPEPPEPSSVAMGYALYPPEVQS